jgi:hypothetical protein
MADPKRKAPDHAPTTEKLRADVDRGQTGEKVAFPDPAAVPLGADAEAAGAPPSALELRKEAAARPAVPHDSSGWENGGVALYVIIICLIALVIGGAGLLAAGAFR